MTGLDDPTTLFERSPVALFRASATGELIHANAALVSLLGFPDRETLLETPMERIYEIESDQASELEALLRGGAETVRIKVAATRFDSDKVRLAARINPVFGTDGELLFIDGGVIDITDEALSRDALAKSELQYRFLFDSSLVPLFETDFSSLTARLETLRAEGVIDLAAHLKAHPEEAKVMAKLARCTRVNPAGLRLAGADTLEECQAGFVAWVVSSDNRAAFLRLVVAIWQGEDRFEAEVTGRGPNGEHLDLLLSCIIPADDDSRHAHLVVSIVDITEQRDRERAATRAERHFRAVVDRAPIGMSLVDRAGRLESVNQAFEGIFAMSATTLEGRHWSLLLGSQPSRESSEALRRLAAGLIREARFESHVTTGTGASSFIRVNISALPIDVHGSSSFIVQIVDETAQRTAHWELEKLLESRDVLISSLAHGLRTPLTGLVGFTHLLWRDRQRLGQFEMDELLGEIYRGGLEISHLIDDMVVLARSQAGSLNPTREDIEVLKAAQASVESIPGQETIDWSLHGGATAAVDRSHANHLLRGVLSAAANSAVKHVRVDVYQHNGAVMVEVTHDGPALSEAERAALFEPFGQMSGRGRAPKPLGLGLAAARILALANGGYLDYSDADSGPHFVVRLPRSATDGPGPGGEGSRFTGCPT